MPVTQEQVLEVAGELGAKFDEFKQKNDAALAAVKQELAGATDLAKKQSEEIVALQHAKEALEADMQKSNRPGAQGAGETEHKKAFREFITKGDTAGFDALRQKGMSVGSDADGGFAVPEEIDREISSLLRDANPMREVARVITVGTPDYKKLVNKHGGAAGWVGEEDPRSATGTPQLAQVTPFMGELYANPQATQNSLDDIFFNVEDFISSEVAADFAEAECTAFTTGNGSKKPKGFLAYATAADDDKTRAFGTLQHVESGGSGAITADDIKKFVFKLKRGYRANGQWMGNSTTLGEIMSLKDSQGQYLWRPGLELGQPSTLGAYAFVENEDMPDIEAGANAIAFGDFMRGYYIIDRMGTTVLRDPFSNKPFVGFYTTKRMGGMLVDSNAIKVLKIKA